MIPANLTAARAALGLSQVALAETLGIHPTMLNRWERGRAKIPTYLALALYGLGQQRWPRIFIDPQDGHLSSIP